MPEVIPTSDSPSPRRVACFLGTRPEAIKMAPVIRAIDASAGLRARVVSTGQHREMLRQVEADASARAEELLIARRRLADGQEEVANLRTLATRLSGEVALARRGGKGADEARRAEMVALERMLSGC